jgi:oligopeptidase B
MKKQTSILTLLILLASCLNAPAQTAELKPPQARKIARSLTLHGDTRVDDYFWLREKSDLEVISYIEAENAYAAAMMKGTEGLQQALYKEMLGRIKETDLSVPYRQGEYFYYSRTEEGKQYPIHCRKRGGLDAKEEVTLDLNELAKGHKVLRLGSYSVSPDGRLLAYSIDTTGARDFYLYVKDLRTGELLPDRFGTVSWQQALWANDNQTFFYVTHDGAKRAYRLFKHCIGKDSDELIYEEKDAMFSLFPSKSRSGAYIFVPSASLTATEVRYISADRPSEPFNLLLPREAGREYFVDHHGDLFYIRVNDAGRNFRLVSAPISDPQKKNWKELIPHRKDVMLEGMDFFANHYVAYEREDGLIKARVTDLRSNQAHRIEFPEPVYAAFADADWTFDRANPEFNTRVLRFSYESFTTPRTVFDYDMETRKRVLLKQTDVLGGYRPADYNSERVYATASDGTRIPISLVYKKELRRDGARPMLLTAYGSYGFPHPVDFSSARLSLLDRGVIFATAHIRGGGEMGKSWHDQGRMMQKRNTFTDFIAAAERLIAEKYTSKEGLVIEGGSAGGLLMGAVTNMRPDLFKAVVAQVPFVDVLNSMSDPSLPLTIEEYEEWGNPNVKAEYDYIKSYCPYTNITAKEYPAMLVLTSLNDTNVMYWEPVKYVARLRATKTDKNTLLLKTNMGAGHGGSSGRYDALKESAFAYSFILSQLGITK